MSKKVLFLDLVHPILHQRLESLGFLVEEDFASTKEQIEAKIDDYFGLVIRSRFPLDGQFLNKAKSLKFIARSGAGLENIDKACAKELGIQVFNSPEGNRDAVGEHVIGMLLMLFNELKRGDSEVRNGVWDREGNRGVELAGKTVGIIGYGHMGSSLAEKLAGFGCSIIAHDKYKSGFGGELVKEVGLKEVFEQTDILSIHLPLSEETHHYVNQVFLEQFKKPIYVINTARGNNVSIKDLVEALKSKRVLGACLDVLEYETKSFETIEAHKLSVDFRYLIEAQNVILSPHVAGWTNESYEKLSTYLADKIEAMFGE